MSHWRDKTRARRRLEIVRVVVFFGVSVIVIALITFGALR